MSMPLSDGYLVDTTALAARNHGRGENNWSRWQDPNLRQSAYKAVSRPTGRQRLIHGATLTLRAPFGVAHFSANFSTAQR